jgi:hypothetical protein
MRPRDGGRVVVVAVVRADELAASQGTAVRERLPRECRSVGLRFRDPLLELIGRRRRPPARPTVALAATARGAFLPISSSSGSVFVEAEIPPLLGRGCDDDV